MKNYQLLRFPDDTSLAAETARNWVQALHQVKSPRYTVAFSGGRIAKTFFIALTQQTWANVKTEVHYFWADERCVPATDPESNFLLAKTNFFDPLQVPPNQLHRIRGEESPALAAQKAEQELKEVTGAATNDVAILDQVFLGMGEDGHIASLFPTLNSEPLTLNPLYFPVIAPKPPPNRITLSYNALTQAKSVWVIASGKGKEEALAASLAGQSTPLGVLLKSRKETLIFTDIPR